MNIIVPSSTTPQDENTSPKQEVVIENTGSAIEESLSEVPLTSDQKIEKLTAEVRNLTNGLNQLIDLSKIMMKNQIESASTLEKFMQSTDTSLATIVQKQAGIDVLLQSEKNRVLSKNLMSALQNYNFGNNHRDKCVSLRNEILSLQNINAKDGPGYTLLIYAVLIEDESLVSFLLKFPEIEVDNFSRQRANPSIYKLLKEHLSNKKE